MYSGSGTQVCTNGPLPIFNNNSNCYHPSFIGSYPQVYPNNVPYFAQSNCYNYPQQDFRNFGPVDTRFSQNAEDQIPTGSVFQPPVGFPVHPTFPPYNNHYTFPPPSMPPNPNYPMLPQNGIIGNHFHNNSSPSYPPSTLVKQNNGKQLNGKRFHPYHRNNRVFGQEKPKHFHCGSCDKDFYTQVKYDQHIAEHVSCGLDGCTYKAHPMVVQKHIAMQHRNGLFNRIVKGNSPEELNKWITERKKHYPTQEKISEKHVQKDEMEKRGERYDCREKSVNNRIQNRRESRNRQKSKFRNEKSFGQNPKKFGSNSNRTNRPFNEAFKPSAKKKESKKNMENNFEYHRNLPPFRGTEYYLLAQTKNNDLNYSDSDTEQSSFDFDSVPTSEETIISTKPWQIISSLDLIRGYDSVEDSDDCGEFETTNSFTKPELSSSKEDTGSEPEECSSKLPVPDFILNDVIDSTKLMNNEDSSVEESSSEVLTSEPIAPCEKERDVESKNCSKKSAKKRKRNRNEKVGEDSRSAGNCESRPSNQSVDHGKSCKEENKTLTLLPLPRKRYKPPTLLEKLLAPEIKHERNVILQCVRYVVNNNYFGIDSVPNTSNGIH